MNELWKEAASGYDVSNMGRIRSFRSPYGTGPRLEIPRILKPVSVRGYNMVTIDGRMQKLSRLVCRVFLGPSNLQVNHKNGIKSDDRLENLEYCTCSENLKHAYKTRLRPSGETHHKAKLTKAQVAAILRDPRSHRSIASDFNVSQVHVSRLKRREAWLLETF